MKYYFKILNFFGLNIFIVSPDAWTEMTTNFRQAAALPLSLLALSSKFYRSTRRGWGVQDVCLDVLDQLRLAIENEDR